MVGLDLGVQGWRNIFAAPGVLLLLPSTNLPHRELWTDLLEFCKFCGSLPWVCSTGHYVANTEPGKKNFFPWQGLTRCNHICALKTEKTAVTVVK